MFTLENPFILKDGTDILNIEYFEFRGYVFSRKRCTDSSKRYFEWTTKIEGNTIYVFNSFQRFSGNLYFVSLFKKSQIVDIRVNLLKTNDLCELNDDNVCLYSCTTVAYDALTIFFNRIFSREMLLYLHKVKRITDEHLEILNRFENLIEIKDVLE